MTFRGGRRCIEVLLLVLSRFERFLDVQRHWFAFSDVLKHPNSFSEVLTCSKRFLNVIACYLTFYSVLRCSEACSSALSGSKSFLKVWRRSSDILCRSEAYYQFLRCKRRSLKVLRRSLMFWEVLSPSEWGYLMGSVSFLEVLRRSLTCQCVFSCSKAFSLILIVSERFLTFWG